MAQDLDYTKPESGVTTFGELYAIIRNHIEAVGTCFRGTSFPTNPKEGQLCFRSDIPEHYVYHNTAWVTLDSLLTTGYNLVPERSQFADNLSLNYSINCGAAGYWVKDKWAFWTTEISTAAVGSPSEGVMYYLYLDYSAITSKVVITTNTPFIWSTTAPSYNATYRAWMNGDDRCIFGIPSQFPGESFFGFFHTGNYVYYDYASVRCGTATKFDKLFYQVTPSNTATDCYVPVPDFVTRASCIFEAGYVDAGRVIQWLMKDPYSGIHIVGYLS